MDAASRALMRFHTPGHMYEVQSPLADTPISAERQFVTLSYMVGLEPAGLEGLHFDYITSRLLIIGHVGTNDP